MKGKAFLIVGALAVAVSLLIFTGCPEKPAEPYVIGGIFSITGPASYLGDPENKTMEMVAAEINAKGGIKGHPVKLAAYDDEGDVTKARLNAEKLIQKEIGRASCRERV